MQTTTDQDQTPSSPRRRSSLWPRPETVLLGAALLGTMGAKLSGLWQYSKDDVLPAWLAVIAPDVIFFLAVVIFFRLMYLALNGRLAGRINLLIAALIMTWSVPNGGWLYITGVQLQPAVVGVLLRDAGDFLPELWELSTRRPMLMVPTVVGIIIGLAWVGLRLLRPLPERQAATHRMVLLFCTIAIAVIALVEPLIKVTPRLEYGRQVIGSSSHWLAALDTLGLTPGSGDLVAGNRSLPRAGTRNIGLPPVDASRPNIVILMLESVSYKSSGLGNPELTSMPVLEKLAAEGVEFTTTRVPMPLTSKAFWSILSGTTPDMSVDYIDSVLADEPFESLATLLARRSYRSGFFQMSKGTFRCTPGIFGNLDFDWAWFRENLQDPSANLGYLGGDDFRLIEPAFDWATESDDPFLLAMITSVAHEPWTVPEWWGDPVEGRFERYMQSVRYSDDFIAGIMDALEERGLASNTILCVIGDHGQGFSGGSAVGRWSPQEDLIRVPWVIHWPGHIEPGTRVTGLCSQLDVAPTLLELAGFDVSQTNLEGLDALGEIPEDRRVYFASCFHGSPIGFVEGDRKVVCLPYQRSVVAYDLGDDPDEAQPSVITGDDAQHLADELLRWQASMHLQVDTTRFRERLLYDHWKCFSSGDSSWAVYQELEP